MPSRKPKDYYLVMVRRDDETKYSTYHMHTKWDYSRAMDRMGYQAAYWDGNTAKVSYGWKYDSKEDYVSTEARLGRPLQEPIILTDKN